MTRSLFHASVLVSLALLLSRLSGLIREQVLGAHLGLSAEMDGALLILTLPDLTVGLLLSGGFTAALVPALSRAQQSDRVALSVRMIVLTGFGAALLGAMLFAAMPLVLALLAPSLDATELSNFRAGFALSMAAIPISAAIGVASSYLHVKGNYSIPALSVLAFNGSLVVYFLVGHREPPVDFAAFGLAVVLAAGLRFVLQGAWIPEILKGSGREASQARFAAGFAGSFVKGIAGASLVVAMPLAFRSLYALGGDGELARFNYALRIFELPMGILIGPITVIFLPLLSQLYGTDDGQFRSRAALALRAAFLLGLAGALTVVLFAQPIVSLLFGFGELRGHDSIAIADAVRVILLALPFMAAFQALCAALNASNRTGEVFRISCIAFALSLALALALHACGAAPAVAAETGFLAFGILASAVAIRAVFGGRGAFSLLPQLALIALRALAVTAPFLFWTLARAEPQQRLFDLLPMTLLALGILAVNLSVMRDLAQARDLRRASP